MPRRPDMNRRAEIADRALQVVLERGVHKTTMSDIARALEMKRPALYWYFSDLGAVFEAALGSLQQQVLRYVVDRVAQESHPIDQLYVALAAVVEFYQDKRALLIGLFQLWAVTSTHGDPESAIAQERELVEAPRGFLIALVAQGIAEGQVRPCVPEALVDTVLTLIGGAQVQRVTRDADLTPVLHFVREQLLEPLRSEVSP